MNDLNSIVSNLFGFNWPGAGDGGAAQAAPPVGNQPDPIAAMFDMTGGEGWGGYENSPALSIWDPNAPAWQTRGTPADPTAGARSKVGAPATVDSPPVRSVAKSNAERVGLPEAPGLTSSDPLRDVPPAELPPQAASNRPEVSSGMPQDSAPLVGSAAYWNASREAAPSVQSEVRQGLGPRLVSITDHARSMEAGDATVSAAVKNFSMDPRFDNPNVNPELRTKFSKLQASMGEAFGINSVYRDPSRNARVRGAKRSQHIHGNAVDVNVAHLDKEQRVEFIRKASALGFKGVGVYNNTVHLDVGSKRAWGPSHSSDSIPAWARPVIGEHLAGRIASLDVELQAPPPSAGKIVPPKDYFPGVDVNTLPAGMRNHNPGNLKYSGSAFQRRNFTGILGPSENTDQGTPQIKFASAEDGMSATARLVRLKYLDNGYDTVEQMITAKNGWTPGFTSAAQNISRTMGVKSDAQLNFEDPKVMSKFIRALITQEHGPSSKMYSDALIQHGVERALR